MGLPKLRITFRMAFKSSDVFKNTFCLLALRVKFSADDIVFFSIFQRKKKKKKKKKQKKKKKKMIWHLLQIVCTIRMKCQIMFSGKNKKIMTNCLMNEPREWLRLKRHGLEENPGYSDVESRNFFL